MPDVGRLPAPNRSVLTLVFLTSTRYSNNMENSNLSKIKPKLRTEGAVSGNFGRPKVKVRPGTLDLTKEILTRDNLRIPPRDAAYERLVEAYNKTTDARLKKGLWDLIKVRRATLTPHKPAPVSKVETIWDEIRETR